MKHDEISQKKKLGTDVAVAGWSIYAVKTTLQKGISMMTWMQTYEEWAELFWSLRLKPRFKQNKHVMLVFYMEEINVSTLVKTKSNFRVLQFDTKIKVIWLVDTFRKRWQLYWDNLRMIKLGEVTRDDLQRRLLAQYSVAILLRHCFEWLPHCSNIATLCCAKTRRGESSRVTLP